MGAPQSPGSTWRIVDLIQWGETYFHEKGFSSPRLEMEYLLTHLLGYRRVDLYLNFDEPVAAGQLSTLKSWIKRRLNHEPIQYITGETEFYGRSFLVEPPILIPRPETERVVEVALDKIAGIKMPAILDVGTGSGCIALTLALERPDAEVTALDPSPDAIRMAKNNAQRLSAKVIWMHKTLEAFEPSNSFDLVVSNPPYVTKEEYNSLMPEVREFEDRQALTDEADGLTLTRYLASNGNRLVKPGGWLVVEVGRPPQPEQALNLFLSPNYTQVELIKDYNGDDRVLVACRV